jgi:ethanolamine utilization protein EutN
MRAARIKGYVTSTVKHPSYSGHRLLIAQPENTDGTADGSPQIVLDPMGAAIGQKVMISSDGSEARKLVGTEQSPARWLVVGVIDPEGALAL